MALGLDPSRRWSHLAADAGGAAGSHQAICWDFGQPFLPWPLRQVCCAKLFWQVLAEKNMNVLHDKGLHHETNT